MTAEIRDLLAKKANLVHQARSIAERDDGGSAENQKSIEDIMSEVEKIDDRVTALENERDDEPKDEENDDEPQDEKPEENSRNNLAARLAAIEVRMAQSQGRYSQRALSNGHSNSAGSRSASKEYHDAWLTHMRSGRGNSIAREFRDLTVTGGDGGSNLITPVKLHEGVVTKLNNLVFIRQFADITQLTDAVSLGNPQLTADIQAAVRGGESSVATADTTMTVGRRDLSPILLSNQIKATWKELTLGNSIVEKLIQERTALSFAYAEESEYMTGDGSGHALGIFTASSNGVPTSRDVTCADGSGHTFDADDILKMIGNLKQHYFANAKIFMHRNYWTQTLLLKDSNDNYLWQVGGVMGGLSTPFADNIRGVPVCRSEYAPYNGSPATGQYIMAICDPSYYRIAETPFVFQKLVELYAASGKVGFLAYKFNDGSPVLPDAFSRLITA